MRNKQTTKQMKTDFLLFVGMFLTSLLAIDANLLDMWDLIIGLIVKTLTAISLLSYFILKWSDIIKKIKSWFK